MDASRFKALGGTSRKYIDLLTNETISRREYYKRDNRPSFEDIKTQREKSPYYKNPMLRYNTVVEMFKDSLVRNQGYKPSEIKVRGDNVTSNLLKQTIKGLKSKDNTNTGIKAQALTILGLREPEWTFAVGETPTEGR